MRHKHDTCDLKIIRDHAHRFCWGTPIKFHDFGRYTVLEYHPWKVDGCTCITGSPDTSVREFKPYVDGQEISTSWGTLEAAVVHALAFAADNDHLGQSVRYVLRAINFKS